MTVYRRNPATGRLAERIPAEAVRDPERTWLTWSWDDGHLTVELLTDADVADWPEVVASDGGGA